MRKFTDAEYDALQWLTDRAGDGVFAGRGGILNACGEVAPVMRSTCNRLVSKGALDTYGNRRVRVTALGRQVLLDKRKR